MCIRSIWNFGASTRADSGFRGVKMFTPGQGEPSNFSTWGLLNIKFLLRELSVSEMDGTLIQQLMMPTCPHSKDAIILYIEGGASR